jgi:HAD superfamily phosphatase (TIGR01668 family)
MNFDLLNIDFFRNIRLALRPRLWVPSIEIPSVGDLDRALPKRIRGLIFDVDQTLVAHGDDRVSEKIALKVRELKSTYSCCLLSNCPRSASAIKRLEQIERQLQIPAALRRRKKPDAEAFRAAIEILKMDVDQVAMIGDRILTDIVGANNFGLTTILVDPLDSKSDLFFWVTIPRFFERLCFTAIGHMSRSRAYER